MKKASPKQCARSRRARLVSNPLYQANTFLAKALKKISKDKFDKMIVFLGWANGQRTNNHVERNNRVFRMMQKTRYKRRKPHTIEKALELDCMLGWWNIPYTLTSSEHCPFVRKRQPS